MDLLKLRCDKCNKEFTLEAKDIKHKAINKIEVQYFECKHCNDKYITSCADDYIMKERQRYKCIAKEIQVLIKSTARVSVNNKRLNVIEYDKKLKEIEDVKLRCLLHSNKLKLKVKDKI